MTIQDKKVTFHYIFLQFYTNCFTHQTKKVVHYSSEKSNKCKELIFPLITSFGVCKHYCTLCNNESPQPPNMILYVLTYSNKTSDKIPEISLREYDSTC